MLPGAYESTVWSYNKYSACIELRINQYTFDGFYDDERMISIQFKRFRLVMFQK